jgi:acetolactate synthase-1/2/3 large subunit
MRIADWIFAKLKEEVDTVFYLPGGGCGVLVDALGQSGLRAVACLHEQGAGYAALGYAQHHGFGVCLVTSGPGATNAITPCLAAWVDSVPVMFISGQVMLEQIATPGMRCKGPQEAPTIEMVTPITKLAALVRGERSAKHWVEQGIYQARVRRKGPVWLDVPLDVQGAVCHD